MPELVSEAARAFAPHLGQRYALFGHYPGGHFYLGVPEVRAQLLDVLQRELDGQPQETGP